MASSPSWLAGGLLVALMAPTQPASSWHLTTEIDSVTGQRILHAAVAAFLSADSRFLYQLTLRCDGTKREAHISTFERNQADALVPRELAWPAPADVRNGREAFMDLQLAIDGRESQRASLRRTHANQGRLIRYSPRQFADARLTLAQQLGRSPDMVLGDPLGGQPMPRDHIAVGDLVPGERVKFSFATLTERERGAIHETCFAAEEKRIEESRCLQDARRQARRTVEARHEQDRRDWCESTRESRRGQLVARFLEGVRRARNGGHALANALKAFLAQNPDAVIPSSAQASQSCPDPHFAIDTSRLATVVNTGSAGAESSRRLDYLLSEAGIVISTTQFALEAPMPTLNTTDWDAAVREAEARCRAK